MKPVQFSLALCLKWKAKIVTMVAWTDIAWLLRRGMIESLMKILKLLYLAKPLSEVGKILDDEDQQISITISDRHVLFDLGYTRVIVSRVLEGEYINYKQIIPEDYKTRVKADTKFLDPALTVLLLLPERAKTI
jgi:DNA polymerase-3 subunit beta